MTLISETYPIKENEEWITDDDNDDFEEAQKFLVNLWQFVLPLYPINRVQLAQIGSFLENTIFDCL